MAVRRKKTFGSQRFDPMKVVQEISVDTLNMESLADEIEKIEIESN